MALFSGVFKNHEDLLAVTVDLALVVLSIDLLLDPSEKTYILLEETIAKKSMKSLVAYSLVCSYSLWICFSIS